MTRFSPKRYARALFAWIGVYIVLLAGSDLLLKGGWVQGLPFKVAVALLPVLAGFGIVNLLTRSYRGMDELEQKILAESIMFAFGATAILTFSYGFAQTVGAPGVSYFMVWPVLAVTWIIGGLIARRRYK